MTVSLTIERMELVDTGQPKTLAELVVAQIKPQLDILLPMPIESVAVACGIEEFHDLKIEGFEGGLIQNEEKTCGFILLKADSRPDRRRFTIAHELGHFLNPYHFASAGVEKLLCTSQDMNLSGISRDPRLGMEAQANEFAANILMPEKPLRSISKLWGSPQIQAIIDLQSICNVSKEASARRFLDLHGDPCAVVFTRDSKVRYHLSRGDFPCADLSHGQPIHRKTLTSTFTGSPGAVSEQEEADPHLWLNEREASKWNLWEEVLVQQNGYRMTLLVAEKNRYEQDQKFENHWTPRFCYK